MATYVDDLCIAAQNPGKIIQTLKEDYKLKVKGDGPLSHHLGADYTRDKDKTLVCQPKKYIDRLVDSYHSMFKQDPPKKMRTPLDKTDHPELDDTELLTGESIQHNRKCFKRTLSRLLVVALRMFVPNTALTAVWTINVSIDGNGF